MATGRFDITEKAIDYAYNNIKDMPGNPGQEVLIEMLREQMANGQIIIDAETGEEGLDANYSGELDFSSPHPEAIDQIINEAILRAEELSQQATLPGTGWSFAEAVSTGNWKIVGYDQ